MKIEILEETNRYDKSMKWHVTETEASGSAMDYWCKTEKDAIYLKNYRETWSPNK